MTATVVWMCKKKVTCKYIAYNEFFLRITEHSFLAEGPKGREFGIGTMLIPSQYAAYIT